MERPGLEVIRSVLDTRLTGVNAPLMPAEGATKSTGLTVAPNAIANGLCLDECRPTPTWDHFAVETLGARMVK